MLCNQHTGVYVGGPVARLGLKLAADAIEAVALCDGEVIARGHGDDRALPRVLSELAGEVPQPTAVTVATDGFERMLATGTGLAPVAALRLAQAGGTILPPTTSWPERLRRAVGGVRATLPGGHDLTGRPLAELDRDAVIRTVDEAVRGGARDVAVAAVGSCAVPDHEHDVAELVRREFPDVAVTLSHELGNLGLRDRENAAVLNSALRCSAEVLIGEVEDALAGAFPGAAVTFVGNDAAALGAEHLRRFPVLALAGDWAATASGAAALAAEARALVVERRGDRVRAGLVVDGRPARPSAPQSLMGIRLGMLLPEVVRSPADGGPASMLAKPYDWPSARAVRFPIVAIGDDVPETSELAAWGLGAQKAKRPDDHRYAAAVGAAMSEPSARVERLVIAHGAMELADTVAVLRSEVLARFVSAGGDPATVVLDDARTTPLSYLPRGAHQVTVSASGRLARTVRR